MNNEIKNTDNIIKNNSDILFIYEAKNTNPNGDPDDENKPRMDYDRNLNLVSDVRLKRYIRDYLEKKSNDDIFVTKIDGSTVDATNRLKLLVKKHQDELLKDDKLKEMLKKKKDDYEVQEKKIGNHLDWLLNKLIDVRFFGATMPIKAGDTGKGSSITFTGPIQFNWGYSLNKVTGPLDSNTITSTFAGAGEEYSTMGKDYRVAYSVIAFHGIISANRAKSTMLSKNDIKVFDNAMINILQSEASTRSKFGQTPLIYMRIEYNNSDYFMGDLRRYVKLVDLEGNDIPFDKSDKLDWNNYKLDLSKLTKKIKNHKDKISKIYLFVNEDIKISGWNSKDDTEFPEIVLLQENENKTK